MAVASPLPRPRVNGAPGGRRGHRLAAFGLWLRNHQRAIRRVQWLIILVYAALMFTPLITPVPTRLSHIWDNATLLAQFAFWGLWWPFVLLSMVVMGRAWCGLLCPEGALTEIASARSLGRAVPRWLRWPGWPFVAFACTTIYGQMVSVYQYPKPVIIVLGGSTVAAMAVGFLYGRDKRVWCRYLCPVNGVFGLLARLAPVHFRVDRDAWARSARPEGADARLNCAPLVPVRAMEGGAACHMCGRCAGFRDAVTLELRPSSQEVVEVGLRAAPQRSAPWDTALIVFGLMGVAPGAFEWSVSPLFVAARVWLVEWLADHDLMWPLQASLPWWILTNYPDNNDMLTPADGALMLAYILGAAATTGVAICACLALAVRALGRWDMRRFHHLALGLLPLAGCGVFLGLSAITLTQLKAEGLTASWAPELRAALLTGALLWSLRLFWLIAGKYTASLRARLLCLGACACALGCGAIHWLLLFWLW